MKKINNCSSNNKNNKNKINFYFVRHGTTYANLTKIKGQNPDTPLNDIGKIQSEIAGKVLSNINFDLPFVQNSWEAKYVSLFLSVDYDIAPDFKPSEGPAGSLNLSIRDPEGGEHGDGYELVTWNNEISERIYILPVIAGNWTIVISGSGLDGVGSILYSGEYEIRVETEGLI